MRTTRRHVQRQGRPRSNGIIPSEPPSAATFDRLTGPVNDMPLEVTQRRMPNLHLRRIALMKAADSSQLSTTQRRSRRNFDENVRREPTFKVGDYVFKDRPQLVATSLDAADDMPNHRCNKKLS